MRTNIPPAHLKRWKHVDSDLDYKQVAEQVYLAAECDKISRDLGYPGHAQTYTTHTILGNRHPSWRCALVSLSVCPGLSTRRSIPSSRCSNRFHPCPGCPCCCIP